LPPFDPLPESLRLAAFMRPRFGPRPALCECLEGRRALVKQRPQDRGSFARRSTAPRRLKPRLVEVAERCPLAAERLFDAGGAPR